MANSLWMVAVFLAGVGFGRLFQPEALASPDLLRAILGGLLFFVGWTVGANREAWSVLKSSGKGVILLPLAATLGTLAAVTAVSPLLPGTSMKEALAAGGGMGYYSLASIMAGELYGRGLALLVLLTNLFRELGSILLAPWIGKRHPLALIAAAGVAAMDVALPAIRDNAGARYVTLGVFSGTVLTLLVPLLLLLIL